MKREIAVVALLVGAVALTLGNTWEIRALARREAVPAVAAPETPVAEQVIELPEDGEAYHTSIFTHADWQARPDERRLVAWFAGNARLASFKAQTHAHHVTPDDPIFPRFRDTIAELPAVVVQQASGRVLYKTSGPRIPESAERLANDIALVFPNRPVLLPWNRPRPCPGPNCPQPKPEPQPAPPDVDVNVAPIPDVAPAEPNPNGALSLALAGGAAALAGGVAYAWRKRYGM
ncbi:MAG: hypothetical protein ACYC35_05060 [Pirellulales bacterium]